MWYRGDPNLNKRHRGRHEAKIKRDRDAKKMKDWILAIVLEAEGHSSAIDGARCRSSHDTYL
jgi:hypothetical protein